MAERHQADIADQEIEGAGKQREAQCLHDEDWIERERRDREENDQSSAGDRDAPFRLAPNRRRRCKRCHQALRPNSPAGRTSSTIIMITKITVFEASGKNTLVSPSTMPSAKPVTIAPMIDPMPPITTTANTTMMMSEPICGDTLEIGAAMTQAK